MSTNTATTVPLYGAGGDAEMEARADELAAQQDDALQSQAEEYARDCYSDEMIEYREWIRTNGHSMDDECPHGYATP